MSDITKSLDMTQNASTHPDVAAVASPSLQRTLLAYAIGGGAVALGGSGAEAAVISSGVLNLSVTSNGNSANASNWTAHQIIAGDALTGFSFGWEWSGSDSQTTILQEIGSTFEVSKSAAGQVQQYTSGTLIDPSSSVKGYGSSSNLASFDGSDAYSSGTWAAGGTGYLGFRFQDASSDHYYGWMEVSVPSSSAAGENAMIVQWAYESTAGLGILAGSTTSIPLPGAAALAAFAAGASGLNGWRRARQRAA